MSAASDHVDRAKHSERAAFSDTLLRVRYAETDQMGYVYYGNYYTYFEVGRVEYMRERGVAYKEMEIADDSFIVVAESRCRYRRPARYDDLLRIRTRVAEFRRRTIRFSYEVLRDADGELLAAGETLHVICDRQGRPKALPDKYRRYFDSADTSAPAVPTLAHSPAKKRTD
ncbi:MAG: thioesterase family protein [Candidatus Acidiferrales bacterium]